MSVFNSLLEFAHAFSQMVYMSDNMQNLVQSAEAASLAGKILQTVKDTHGDAGKLRALTASTQESREKEGYPGNEPLLRDGTLRDSYSAVIGNDPSGGGKAIIIGSPEDVALYHEIGFYNVPAGVMVDARPVLMPSVLEHEKEIVEAFGEAMVGLFTHPQSGSTYHNEEVKYLD
jgi:hypothetical protein